MDKTSSGATKRKILVISPWKSRWSLGEGAGVSDDHYFMKKFTECGFELHFLSPGGGQPPGPALEDVYTHTYPDFFHAMRRWPTALKRILWPHLYNIIVTARALIVGHRLKPDVVMGHSHYSSLPSYMTRELLRMPSVVKLFGVMDLVHTEWPTRKYWSKNIEQILALKIPQDAWIILDDGTQGRDAAQRHGVPQEQVNFLPNGINVEWMTETYDREMIRGEFDIDGDTHVVLFLARLVASKRPEALIRAIPSVLRQTDRPTCFLFVGDGEERSRCEDLVTTLDVGGATRFAGVIPHGRVPEIMSACDVFVSTSNLTNAAIPTCEAMVCGLPVVALDVGNTSEIIRDGETGRLVPDGDTDALATAIADYLNDSGKRAATAERARVFASENFTSWDDRTQAEVDLIESLIKKRGDHPAAPGPL